MVGGSTKLARIAARKAQTKPLCTVFALDSRVMFLSLFRDFGPGTGVEPRQRNKKMLKSRGESQDVVENKGPRKLGCTKT